MTLEGEEDLIKQLESEGVSFVRASDIDMAAFQDATAPTYDAFPEWSDGLFDRVSAILK